MKFYGCGLLVTDGHCRHALFVDMVRAQQSEPTVTDRPVESDAVVVHSSGMMPGAEPPGRPPTRPLDLPVYGREFMSVQQEQ
jgi:hypothetical protein